MVLVWDMGMRLWSLPAACPTMELVGRVSWLYWTAWSTVTTSRSSCKLTLQRPGVYVQTCVWGFGAKTSHSSACIYVASFPGSGVKSCSQTLGRSFVPRLWGEVLFPGSGVKSVPRLWGGASFPCRFWGRASFPGSGNEALHVHISINRLESWQFFFL